MRPLSFLFVRTLVNGIKRAATSPKRAISLIFCFGYYYFLVIRSVVPSSGLPVATVGPVFQFPNVVVLRGIFFGLFALASLFLTTGIFAAKGGFRPADVDVLFPTPVKPEIVLVFRIVRDYVFTLLAPLLFAVIGWRGASSTITALFHNYPRHSLDVLRAGWIAWMLLSLAFVSVGYGASLFVGRSDIQSDSNQKRLNTAVSVVALAALGYVCLRLRQDLTVETLLSLSQSLPLETVFLPATLATNFVMGSLSGDLTTVLISGVGLVCTIALGLSLALTQVGWLYDQAAAKGFGTATTMKLRRSGDLYGLAAERARAGKKSRTVLAGRISQQTYRNSASLVWKEILLQLRGPMAGALLTFCGLLAGYGMVGWLLTNAHGVAKHSLQVFEIALPCLAAYLLGAINGFGGFQEMLRKVDLLKPLPFSASRIVFFEALAKAPIPIFMIAGGGIVLTVFVPADFANNVAGFIMGSTLLMEITGAIALAVVLFPDFQDPTQRVLSGIVMMLAIVICSSPGFGLFIVLQYWAHWPSLAACIPSACILLAITAALAYASGAIYAGYNPNE
jgi:hypothetical protein